MPTDRYSVRHADQRAITNADQAEMQAIANGLAVTDTGLQDEVISGELDDIEVSDRDLIRFNRTDLARENEVGAVRDELLRRSRQLGSAYPFVIDGNAIAYTPSTTGFYEYCLGICQAPTITSGKYVKLPRTFERIVALLVRHHLGSKWRAAHTGAPRDRSVGTTFAEAYQAISQITSGGLDWKWDPVEGYPQRPSIGGDGGVDFVVWRPALDGRIGQLYILGQCACGNDWGEKFNDISLQRLGKWFRPVSHIDVIRCFTTPFWLSPGNFEVAHADAGWTLDRARLTLMAEEAQSDFEFSRWIPSLPRFFQLVAKAA